MCFCLKHLINTLSFRNIDPTPSSAVTPAWKGRYNTRTLSPWGLSQLLVLRDPRRHLRTALGDTLNGNMTSPKKPPRCGRQALVWPQLGMWVARFFLSPAHPHKWPWKHPISKEANLQITDSTNRENELFLRPDLTHEVRDLWVEAVKHYRQEVRRSKRNAVPRSRLKEPTL